ILQQKILQQTHLLVDLSSTSQEYPGTGVSASQIEGHANIHSVPQCAPAPQEFPAYDAVHPPSTFGGESNF
uniref:Uncharacterized protein n=1 Tax=Aegilops tauschii subsp. strangulata TaxID=200361 RepID=A0A453JNF6_AEGTS